MKDKKARDNSASLPPNKSGYRHFFEKQIDGLWRPITFRYLEKYGSYEYEGRIYTPQLVEAMIRASVLWPAVSPKARVYTLRTT